MYKCEDCVSDKAEQLKLIKALQKELSGVKEKMQDLRKLFIENNEKLCAQFNANQLLFQEVWFLLSYDISQHAKPGATYSPGYGFYYVHCYFGVHL